MKLMFINGRSRNNNKKRFSPPQRLMLFLSLLPLIILLMPIAFADVSTFYDGTTTKQLNFTGNQNLTTYVNILKDVNVYNATLYMSGFTLNTTDYCIQETFNVSTPCGGSSDNGTFDIYVESDCTNYENMYDDDWDTYTEYAGPACYMYINYTKPANATNESLFHYKDSVLEANISIPSQCWNAYDTILSFFILTEGYTNWYCWNTTTFHPFIIHPPADKVYEEEMVWDMNTYPTNIYITIGTPSQPYNWNAPDINNSNYNINLSMSEFNTVLSNNCTCQGCSNVSYYCKIPILVHSDTVGGLSLTDLNINYITWLGNIPFYDEITQLLLDSITIFAEFVSDDYSYNLSTTTGSISLNLSQANEYRITYYDEILYTSRRSYYLDTTTLQGGGGTTLPLYMLSSANSTDVTFVVIDEKGVKLENATVKLKRYYVDSNTYKFVAMEKTNPEGKAIINVDYNDAYYKVFASHNGYSTETQGQKIFTDTLTITIDTVGDIWENIDIVDGTSTSLTYNNNTRVFSYSFDTAGQQVTGALEVKKVSPLSEQTICSSSETTSSGTLMCAINITSTKDNFIAKGSILPYGSSTPYVTNVKMVQSFIDNGISKFGNQGVLFSIILGGTFAGLAASSPAMAIVFFIVGLFSIVYFGFSAISIVFFISIAIIGGLLIWKVRG